MLIGYQLQLATGLIATIMKLVKHDWDMTNILSYHRYFIIGMFLPIIRETERESVRKEESQRSILSICRGANGHRQQATISETRMGEISEQVQWEYGSGGGGIRVR